MSTLALSREIGAPPDRLFTLLSAECEGGTVPIGKEAETLGSSPPPMGLGLRILCPAAEWSLPEDLQVEVVDYREPEGWRAVSTSGGSLTWEIRIRPSTGGSTLTLRVDYRPEGLGAGIRELALRRRRRAAVQRLLDEWKRNAERQEGLRRLRAATRPPGPRSSRE